MSDVLLPGSLYYDRLYESFQTEQKLAIYRARRDVNAFTEFVVMDPKGDFVQQGGCHVQIQRHLDENRLGLVCLHRAAGKSVQGIISRTLFQLGKDPNLRIKFISQDDATAVKRLKVIRGYIEKSARLRMVFPELKPNTGKTGWTDHTLLVERETIDIEPTLEAKGVLSSAVGGRADILKFDDVVSFENAVANPAKREVVKGAFYDSWFNLLSSDESRVEYYFTPWHAKDLSAELIEKAQAPGSEWALLRLPVEEINGRLISPWPEHWTHDALVARRRQVGPSSFARSFLLRAIDDADCPLLRYADRMVTDIEPSWLHTEGRQHWPRVIAVDLAVSQKKNRSETVVMTIVAGPNGVNYVDPLHSYRAKMSAPTTARLIVKAWKETGADLVLVENNAYQQSLIDWIQQAVPSATGIPIQGWTTGKQKHDPQIGVPGMATQLDNGTWALPFGSRPHTSDCPCVLCHLVTQVRQWPVGDRDDVLMAWWIGSQAVRKLGGTLLSKEAEIREDTGFAHLADDVDTLMGGSHW